MKKTNLLTIFLISLIACTALASSPFQSPIQSKLGRNYPSTINFGLKILLRSRCKNYFSDQKEKRKDCKKAARVMVRLLQCKNPTSSVKSSCFFDSLNEYANSDEATAFLEKLNSQITSNNNTDVLAFVRENTADEYNTLRVMAVLFQDFFGTKPPSFIEYLAVNAPRGFTDQMITTLTTVYGNKINILPDSVDPVNMYYYHFYVPAYLSYLLHHVGGFSKEISTTVAASFNLIYEEEQHKDRMVIHDSKSKLLGAYIKTLFSHRPIESFEASADEESLKDIYLGIMGPVWALAPEKVISYPQFVDQFATDPVKFMQNL